MAQYRGTVEGGRSQASRLGHKTTGLTTRCNGWNIGVTCVAYYDKDSDTDLIDVYKTGGSSNGRPTTLIATVVDSK